MRLLRLPPLVLSLALLGSPKLASPANAAQSDQNVQHLTCLTNVQPLVCTIDETQETVAIKRMGTVQVQDTPTHHSELFEQISNVFIGVLFGVLPIALIAVIILHHKRDLERTKRLEQLEKIWHES